MPSTLVLGGARSGKTAWAQRRAEGWGADGGRLVMIVSAQAHDAEMAERIARHRADRSGAWTTVEAPLNLAEALATLPPDRPVLVDCLEAEDFAVRHAAERSLITLTGATHNHDADAWRSWLAAHPDPFAEAGKTPPEIAQQKPTNKTLWPW